MGSILPEASDYDALMLSGLGLGQIFYQQMLEDPNALAIVDEEDYSFTYREVHNHAIAIAQALSDHGYNAGDSVGILVDHGIWDASTQVAILYAGGTCVPLDPQLPHQQIVNRLKKTGARYLLADEANANRDLPFTILSVHGLSNSASSNKAKAEAETKTNFPLSTGVNHCSHLIHTSGTTSEPKAVQIAARSIIHVTHHAPYEPVRKSDVVGHPNKTSFDVALFDIWGALLRGAAVGVLSKRTVLDSAALGSAIRQLGITITAITAPLVNLAATTHPTTFAPLRVVLMGGEAVNLRAMEAILTVGPPKHLVNAYGPTECCVYCLTHEITFEDIRADKVSIGETIGQNVCCVCDEDGNPVDEGEEGELLVGGPGVSPGYLNQPEKNAKAFVAVPGMTDPGTNQPYRMYRTGDLVRRRSDGQHDFLGRRDEQVKIRGFRVELGAVRAALVSTGHFSDVFPTPIDSKAEGASATLVAFAVLHAEAGPDAVLDAIKTLKETLPEFMVPHIEVVSEIPLNAHAKVDRRELEQLYHQRRERLLSIYNAPVEEKVDTRQQIASMWATILATPVPDLADDDDFFALGGTSLQASLLISRIRKQLAIEISLLTLYDHPTLGQLAAVVDQHRTASLAPATIRNEEFAWTADTKLADELELPLEPVVDWRRDTEGRVFLTGATGFVGAFALASLLVLPGVYQVGCLVRATTPVMGYQRIRAALVKYELWQDSFATKVLPLCGTLEDKWLGLGEERFQEIARWSSVIFHLGALVNYTKPYSLHRPANVIGTLNVARLAVTSRPKSLHYCSSISCFGPTGFVTGAKIIYEDVSLLPHLRALTYDHGYAQSQWVADRLLQRLMQRGFPIALYRPGFITGDSKTGICNPDDFFSRLIRASLDLGCYPELQDQRKEFIPVDYAVATMLHISESVFSLGHAYHLIPPRAASIDMVDTMELLSQARGTPIHSLSYERWVQRLSASSHASLQPLLPMLAEKVHDGLSRWELYEKMPIYDATNTRRAIAAHPHPLICPPFDRALMKKYVDYLFKVENGKL
jgi:amino acid adenylation domain-containing protein/thioester reductase-like protein